MKFLEVLVVLNLCAIASVHGQLNASRLELTERFGQPTSEKGNQAFGSTEYVFLKDGMVIRASMLDDRCHMISYLKSQLPWPTQEEISSLMELNSAGATWDNEGVRLTSVTTAGKTFSQVHYPRSDGGAYLVKAINGAVFKSAHWHQFEEGTREQRLAEAPKTLQSTQATSIPLPQRVSPAPVRFEETSLPPTRQYTVQPLPLATGRASKPFGVSRLLILALIVAAPVFRVVMRSPSVKGWIGEKLTYFLILKRLDPAVYRIFNDIYLPRPDRKGTTQIDHVVVSPYGIFVIETKNMIGWIFGGEEDREWMQMIYRKRFRFQNPVHQNRLHVQALQQFLALPDEVFHPVVFFVGMCQFKTTMPTNALDSGLRRFVEGHSKCLLSPHKVLTAVEKLEHVKAACDAADRREHIRSLNRLHSPTVRGGDITAPKLIKSVLMLVMKALRVVTLFLRSAPHRG